jgi:AcrR family transcriptional regulator
MSANTKEIIMKAASSVFAKEGFKGATTKKIALEAGVNEATLFRLYGSKENLFKEVLLKNSRILTIREMLRDADAQEPIGTKLIEVGKLFKQMYDANPDAALIFYRCAISRENMDFLSDSIGVRAYGSLVDYFRMMQMEKKITLKATAEEAAFYYLSMVHGALKRQLIFKDLEEGVNIELLVSIFLGGIAIA